MTGDTFVTVKIIEAADETPRVRRLLFEMPPELALHHVRPGQLLQVRSAAGDAVYALGNPPGDLRGELLLKRGHAMADALVSSAISGGTLAVGRPFGSGFPIERALDDDALLFAVGSAIAPIRSVIEWLLARPRTGRPTLFYGERSVDDFAYRGSMERWREHGVEVVLCSSRGATSESPPTGEARGYVHEVARSHALHRIVPARTVAFLCGMKAMVVAVQATLSEAGLAADRMFLNY